jgi:thermostable 8-oxoguanine DNA glycosylase
MTFPGKLCIGHSLTIGNDRGLTQKHLVCTESEVQKETFWKAFIAVYQLLTGVLLNEDEERHFPLSDDPEASFRGAFIVKKGQRGLNHCLLRKEWKASNDIQFQRKLASGFGYKGDRQRMDEFVGTSLSLLFIGDFTCFSKFTMQITSLLHTVANGTSDECKFLKHVEQRLTGGNLSEESFKRAIANIADKNSESVKALLQIFDECRKAEIVGKNQYICPKWTLNWLASKAKMIVTADRLQSIIKDVELDDEDEDIERYMLSMNMERLGQQAAKEGNSSLSPSATASASTSTNKRGGRGLRQGRNEGAAKGDGFISLLCNEDIADVEDDCSAEERSYDEEEEDAEEERFRKRKRARRQRRALP